MAKVTVERRKAQGLCIACGKQNDRLPKVYCSECNAEMRERGREYYRLNKNKVLKRTHRNYATNRKKHNQLTNDWFKRNPAKSKYYREVYKVRALRKVAGIEKPACVYCGCDDVRFLEINHKNGGGSKEAWQFIGKNGHVYRAHPNFYTAIIQGKRPVDDLEIVCRPHNAWHFLKLRYGPDATRIQITWLPKP